MKFSLAILLSWWITQAYSLFPGKLPNGQLKKFTATEQYPCSDLKAVEDKQALLISKHWLNNIIVHNVIQPEDKHVLERIHRLHHFIENNVDSQYVCMLWVPEGVMYEVLFIVILRVTINPNIVTVCLLVPSPYWDSSQIESYELKRALEDLATNSKKSINFEALYENDARYKLAWHDWQ